MLSCLKMYLSSTTAYFVKEKESLNMQFFEIITSEVQIIPITEV